MTITKVDPKKVIVMSVTALFFVSIWVLSSNMKPPTIEIRKDPNEIAFHLYDEDMKWKPTEEEKIDHKLCLLVAYRDSKDPRTHGFGRKQQLETFREKMKVILAERNINYTLIISEQEEGLLFNKGLTFNCGFLMAYKRCDYFIFHDIDMFPVSLNNSYSYPYDAPQHLVASSQLWIMDKDIAGGVLSMTNEQFITCGGYSNAFWGWGFEDDDIFFRMKNMGYRMTRLSLSAGNYSVVEHDRHTYEDLLENEQTIVSHAYSLLSREGHVEYEKEGVKSVNASLLSIVEETPDYFHFIYRPHNRLNLLVEEQFIAGPEDIGDEFGFYGGVLQGNDAPPPRRATVVRPKT